MNACFERRLRVSFALLAALAVFACVGAARAAPVARAMDDFIYGEPQPLMGCVFSDGFACPVGNPQ